MFLENRHNILRLAGRIRNREVDIEDTNIFLVPRTHLNVWCQLVDEYTRRFKRVCSPNKIINSYIQGEIGQDLIPVEHDTVDYSGYQLTTRPNLATKRKFWGILSERPHFKRTKEMDNDDPRKGHPESPSMSEALLYDNHVYKRAMIWYFIKEQKMVDVEAVLINGKQACLFGGGHEHGKDSQTCSILIKKFLVEKGFTKIYRMGELRDDKCLCRYDHYETETITEMVPSVVEETDDPKWVRVVYDIDWIKSMEV